MDAFMKKTFPNFLCMSFSILCLFTFGEHSAFAQNYPNKTVKLINSFPPGGPSDVIARSLAESLQNSLKQPFIVENRAGAGGNLGADFVAKSAPDGYTVLIGIDTTFTINPNIYKNIPYKINDLKPVMVIASSGLLMGVNPATQIKNVSDLIARGRGKGLTFSSGSNGSPGHLAAEILGDVAKVKVTHVPYKGNTPAVTAVISGEVDGGVLATPGMLSFVKAQQITPLFVTSRKRSAMLPDIPTSAEVGLKDLSIEVFYVAMVPAATPNDVVAVLQKGMLEALSRPEVKARLEAQDLVIENEIGQAAVQRLENMRARYAPIIKATGMQIE
jgi:tripartite-type tricarboxylate transporter receptor subunit TctC